MLIRYVAECSTVFVRPILIQTLYVCFVRNLTSTAGISNFTWFSTVEDSSFSTFVVRSFAILSPSCMTCFPEPVGFGPLPPSLRPIATFSSVSLDSTGFFILGPSRIRLGSSCSRLQRNPPWHPSALGFCEPTDWRFTLCPLLCDYGCATSLTASSSVLRTFW